MVGLPIGNQTSQLFGNLYLDELDHFIKEQLRVPGYLRYMDDLICFADTKKQIWEFTEAIGQFTNGLRLRLHERKTNLIPTRCGIPFLGFRVFPNKIVPFRKTVLRFRARLRQLQRRYDNGDVDLLSIRQSVFSYWGYFQIAGTPNRFRRIVRDFPFFEDLIAEAKERKEQGR